MATLVIKTKALEIAGIIEMNGVNKINIAVQSSALRGMPDFENLVKGFKILSPFILDKEYKFRVVEKRAEFKADAAEVSTTKLIRAAAHLIPINWKIITKGDWSAGISCHR